MPLSARRLVPVLQWTLLAFVALLFVVSVAKPIVLTASDLGRHLTNGEIFLDSGTILTTNEYSYTHQDFPFVNHHWGSGVLFELARRARGFVGVSLFGLGIVLLTVTLYLRIAWKHGSFWLAMVGAAFAAPIFAGRAEIRPELFSYLLSAVFLWILLGVRGKTMPRTALAALPVLTLVWVNLHIYFFLAIGWTGAFFLDALFRAWREPTRRTAHLALATDLALALGASCLLTLLNPNGWQGAVAPLLIFNNYAYAVAENQPLLAILRKGNFPPTMYFLVGYCALALSWIWRLWRDRENKRLPDVALLVLSVFAALIGFMAIRNLTVSAYALLVSLAYAWSDLDLRARLGRSAAAVQCSVPVVVLVVLVSFSPGWWKSNFRTIGLGVAPNILRSIQFFAENDVRGPIFNNYDVGGFLTYGLYPQERVFVDNRPEAYPGEFFTRILLPMQMNDDVWKRVDADVGFGAIFFFRHDMTPWGQSFMIRRVQDPEWAPVYADAFVLLLVRRNDANAATIEKYELPPSTFTVKDSPRR